MRASPTRGAGAYVAPARPDCSEVAATATDGAGIRHDPPASRWVPRLAHAFLRIFGATLVVSGFLKLDAPFLAARAVAEWFEMQMDAVAYTLVDLLSVAEIVLGSVLVLRVSERLAARVAVIFGAAFLCARVAMLWRDPDGDCGCFGGVRLPATVGIVVAVTGMIAGWHVARAAAATVVFRRLRGSCAALTALAAVVVVLARPPAPALTGAPAILAGLGPQVRADDVVMVGSWSCDHCLEAISEFARLRGSASTDPEAPRVHFVVRASEELLGDGGDARDSPWLVTHKVADRVWWSVLVHRPPVFLVRTSNGVELRPTWPG